MNVSNDHLQFGIMYNFIGLILSEFYSLQKYHFFSIENETIFRYYIHYISRTVAHNGKLIQNASGLNDFEKTKQCEKK